MCSRVSDRPHVLTNMSVSVFGSDQHVSDNMLIQNHMWFETCVIFVRVASYFYSAANYGTSLSYLAVISDVDTIILYIENYKKMRLLIHQFYGKQKNTETLIQLPTYIVTTLAYTHPVGLQQRNKNDMIKRAILQCTMFA